MSSKQRDSGPPDYLPIAPPPFLGIWDPDVLERTLERARCLETDEQGERIYPFSLFYPVDHRTGEPRKNCIDELHGVAVCNGEQNPNLPRNHPDALIGGGKPCPLRERCARWAREEEIQYGTWGGEQEWKRKPRRASGVRKKA